MRAMGLDTEEAGSAMAFLRRGYKASGRGGHMLFLFDWDRGRVIWPSCAGGTRCVGGQGGHMLGALSSHEKGERRRRAGEGTMECGLLLWLACGTGRGATVPAWGLEPGSHCAMQLQLGDRAAALPPGGIGLVVPHHHTHATLSLLQTSTWWEDDEDKELSNNWRS